MKTDIYKFEKAVTDFDSISEAAAKISAYNSLDKKQELRLTLLCEELVELLPNLLIFGNGEFWIENNGSSYEIHAVVEADDLLTAEDREEILSVSSSGKNAAATGIINKIRIAAETMLASYVDSAGASGVYSTVPDIDYAFYDQGMYADPLGYTNAWSLDRYRTEVKKGSDDWDELEKSVIAKVADDVTVGIIKGKVEIIVTKKF